MGNLIPYFISIAALPLGAARRKFSHHKGLSGCDMHHRKCSGWQTHMNQVCVGERTQM